VFGPWWQASDDEDTELAALRNAGVPMSVAQTYTHYLPCGDHRGRRDDERARRVGVFQRDPRLRGGFGSTGQKG